MCIMASICAITGTSRLRSALQRIAFSSLNTSRRSNQTRKIKQVQHEMVVLDSGMATPVLQEEEEDSSSPEHIKKELKEYRQSGRFRHSDLQENHFQIKHW